MRPPIKEREAGGHGLTTRPPPYFLPGSPAILSSRSITSFLEKAEGERKKAIEGRNRRSPMFDSYVCRLGGEAERKMIMGSSVLMVT